MELRMRLAKASGSFEQFRFVLTLSAGLLVNGTAKSHATDAVRMMAVGSEIQRIMAPLPVPNFAALLAEDDSKGRAHAKLVLFVWLKIQGGFDVGWKLRGQLSKNFINQFRSIHVTSFVWPDASKLSDRQRRSQASWSEVAPPPMLVR